MLTHYIHEMSIQIHYSICFKLPKMCILIHYINEHYKLIKSIKIHYSISLISYNGHLTHYIPKMSIKIHYSFNLLKKWIMMVIIHFIKISANSRS